jgi:uncharacterized protein YbjT (DUF2867 family)
VKVTVVGGKGLLGSHLSPTLTENGHDVTITTRSATSEGEMEADLESGKGLREAMADADVVVHLASDPRKPRDIDVAGTRKLLEALTDGQLIVYMSIVGVDRHPFFYYRAKRETEQMIEASGHRFTILRATQFHDFVAYFLGAASRPPIAFIPKTFVFQPVDTGEVADQIARLIDEPSQGIQPDFAGPAIHTAEYLARSLMSARGKERPMVSLPVFGKSANAFRAGVHTNPDRAVGVRTWEDFLAGES